MSSEGLDCWINFTLIDFVDLANIAKSASRHTTPFTIGVLKLKCLNALKFWIEDKIRMNEPYVAAAFTFNVLTTYIWLYTAFAAAKCDNVEFVNGPQLNVDDWNGFETGTSECLNTIQGSGGVPLSYMLRNDLLCPILNITSSREAKIFWNAPFTGAEFEIDQLRVWTYIAQRCLNTPGWQHIQQYQAIGNGRQAW